MQKNFIFMFALIATIIPSVFGIGRGSVARFHSLLRQYDNPEYRATDRDVIINANYNSYLNSYRPRDSTIAEPGNRTDKYFSAFDGTVGLTLNHIRSNSHFQTTNRLETYCRGSLQSNSNLFNNEMLDIFDTSSNKNHTATGWISDNLAYRYYPLFKRLPRRFFVELNNSVYIGGDYLKTQQYQHNKSGFSESSIRQGSTTRTLQGTADVQPFVGYGKKLPVAPVYRAFEIERILKQNQAVQSTLSDSTLLHLAALFGSLESFRISRDRPDKFLMDTIEQTLRHDPVVDSSLLDAFTMFKIFECLGEPFPILFYGFGIKLGSGIHVSGNLDFDTAAKLHHTDLDIDYTIMNLLQAGWTFPVFSRLFVELTANPFFNFNKEYIGAGAGFGAHYFITNRIIAHAAISEIPLRIVIPYGKPGLIDASMDFFIEDHIMVRLHYFKRFDMAKFQRQEGDLIRYQSEGMALQVDYDF